MRPGYLGLLKGIRVETVIILLSPLCHFCLPSHSHLSYTHTHTHTHTHTANTHTHTRSHSLVHLSTKTKVFLTVSLFNGTHLLPRAPPEIRSPPPLGYDRPSRHVPQDNKHTIDGALSLSLITY